jgi:hypothetical protein
MALATLNDPTICEPGYSGLDDWSAFMPKTTKTLADEMDQLFSQLDAAKLAPVTVLKSEAQKEHYESLVMFAFRKLQAARYHVEQVDRRLEMQRKELDALAAAQPQSGSPKPAIITSQSSQSANEFGHELAAFFAAVRSTVDFLARVSATHLKGVQTDTVTTLLGMAKNKTSRILKVIADNADWLCWLRDYRDHLVHRLVVATASGGKIQWKHGQGLVSSYPVIVPADIPNHVPDTRRARALFDPSGFFNELRSEGVVTYSDGKEKVLERTVKYLPTEGHIEIEKLMHRELKKLEEFFHDVIRVLAKLDFQIDPAQSK